MESMAPSPMLPALRYGSVHDRPRNLIIRVAARRRVDVEGVGQTGEEVEERAIIDCFGDLRVAPARIAQGLHLFVGNPITDRKSTRLNSSHANISYAVFCLKKKNQSVLV